MSKDKLNSINSVFAGGFCPTGNVEKFVMDGANAPGKIWSDIKDVLNSADYRVVNLECPFLQGQSPTEKSGPLLNAAPETAQLLKEGRFDLVTLANNHIFDHGDNGISSTLRICREHNIATVGAGLTLQDAQKTYYTKIKDRNVAFINFAENEFNTASDNHGGSNPLDIIDLYNQLREAGRQADLVIVIAHGGHEYFQYPSPRTVKLYRFLADNGADAVIGHHPHCVQGCEVYHGVPIYYSLGNFIFPGKAAVKEHHQGLMVSLSVDCENKCRAEIIPYDQCGSSGFISLMPENEKNTFIEQFNILSNTVTEPDKLLDLWRKFALNKEKSFVYALFPWRKSFTGILMRTGLFYRLIPRLYFLRLLNLIRCESHRDILVAVLKKLLK